MVFYLVVSYICVVYCFALILNFRTAAKSKASIVFSTIIRLNMTILFIPALGTLFSMDQCSNGQLLIQSSMNCWQSEHLAHSIISFIFIALLCIMQLYSSILFFETRGFSHKLMARKWSTAFINSSTILLWLISAFYVCGFGYVFYVFLRFSVFYNYKPNRVRIHLININ